MTTDIDELARSVHDLVTETAARQISREIAHLAEIEVDSDGTHLLGAPDGYRAPATGVITTHVLARSREVPAASVEMRVAVWVSEPGAEPATLLVTRADSDRSLQIAAADTRPEPTSQVRGSVNDFVALMIAHAVSSLNVAMQRSYIHESEASVSEYEDG